MQCLKKVCLYNGRCGQIESMKNTETKTKSIKRVTRSPKTLKKTRKAPTTKRPPHSNSLSLSFLDVVILVYGIPLIVWFLSTFSLFSGLSKLGSLGIAVLIIFGIEWLITDLAEVASLRAYRKRKRPIPAFNLNPLLVITSFRLKKALFSLCLGGVMGLFYVSTTWSAAIGMALVFFTVFSGLEYAAYANDAHSFLMETLCNTRRYCREKAVALALALPVLDRWILGGVYGVCLYVYPFSFPTQLMAFLLLTLMVMGCRSLYSALR
jgi:hypothetical protein